MATINPTNPMHGCQFKFIINNTDSSIFRIKWLARNSSIFLWFAYLFQLLTIILQLVRLLEKKPITTIFTFGYGCWLHDTFGLASIQFSSISIEMPSFHRNVLQKDLKHFFFWNNIESSNQITYNRLYTET